MDTKQAQGIEILKATERARNAAYFNAKAIGASHQEALAAEKAVGEIYAPASSGFPFVVAEGAYWGTSGGMEMLFAGKNVKYVLLPNGDVKYQE